LTSPAVSRGAIRICRIGRIGYSDALERMRSFNATRDAGTEDQLWLVEHDPVFTLGHATRPGQLRDTGSIPVVATERGGQVTYHGPGQVIVYLMLDLRRRRTDVRTLVHTIEQAVIGLLAAHCIDAVRRDGAPGVYVRADDADAPQSGAPAAAGAKIAALGLKIARGCTYHGVALNVAMDLEPFSRIDPCGIAGLAVTDMATCTGGWLCPVPSVIADDLASRLVRLLS
jgi:lipoyl(octanoyl) transferase